MISGVKSRRSYDSTADSPVVGYQTSTVRSASVRVRTPTPNGPGSARSTSTGALGAGSVVVGVDVSGAAWVDGGSVDSGVDDAQPTASTTHEARRRRANIDKVSYGCEPAGIGRPVNIEWP